MSRMLAHVERVEEVKTIYLKDTGEFAESIAMYRVLGWWVIGKKDEYKVGDLVVYIEIDSKILSTNEYFKFLESKKYKVKTMKLNKFKFDTIDGPRPVISQGLIIPLCVVYSDVYKQMKVKVGTDVTEALKIIHIEDETQENKAPRRIDRSQAFYQRHVKFFRTRLGKYLKKNKLFRLVMSKLFSKYISKKKWPTYIVHTDENRIQNMPWILTEYAGKPLVVTEKLDGTSTTFGLLKVGKKFDFAVCSRKVRQLTREQITWYKDAPSNFYWEMADKYNVERVLKNLFDLLGAKESIVIQGETIGPSIQSNKYKLLERDFRPFNLVVDGVKLSSGYSASILSNNSNMKWVPIVDISFILLDSIDAMVEYATDKSVLRDMKREGIVIRDNENTVSFKVISPDFLIKWGI